MRYPRITCVGDGHTRPPWIEKSLPRARRIYRANSLTVILQIQQQEIKVAQIPCALRDPDPLLRRIPAPYVEPGWGLWVPPHVGLRTTMHVRIFRDLLMSEPENLEDLIEGRAALNETPAA